MNNYDRVFTYAAYVQSIKNSLIVAALGARHVRQCAAAEPGGAGHARWADPQLRR